MKFKVDESLPAEAAEILRGAGFIADTVGEEHLSGANDETVASTSRSDNRILVTLDLDFANIRAYPPGEHAGIIVLRVKHQDKPTVLEYLRRLAPALTNRNPAGELWIVDGNRNPLSTRELIDTSWPDGFAPLVRSVLGGGVFDNHSRRAKSLRGGQLRSKRRDRPQSLADAAQAARPVSRAIPCAPPGSAEDRHRDDRCA